MTPHFRFTPEMTGFGSKISHKSENHSELTQNLRYFDQIKVLESL